MGSTRDRAKKTPRYTRIFRRQMQSIAWQHLSGSGVKVLLAIASFDWGGNNGEIFFSDRTGAQMTGLSRNTVRRSIDELMEKGFVYRTEAGGFNRKVRHAATYGLTWERGPDGTQWKAPSHAYESWQPVSKNGNSRAQNLRKHGSNSDKSVETFPSTGAESEPRKLEKRLVSNVSNISEIEPQSVSHAPGNGNDRLDTGNSDHKTRPPDLAELREKLTQHLERSSAGEQSRLAKAIGCPAGTFSKFRSGRNLPEQYREPLQRRLSGRRRTLSVVQ